MRPRQRRTAGILAGMRRWVVGWVLLSGGCLDMNPVFIDPTDGDEAGETTSAPPATDAIVTTEPPDTMSGWTTEMSWPTSTSTDSAAETYSPDTMGTSEPATEGGTTTGLTPQPACGDGMLDPGEECDDQNAYPYDSCTDTCTVAVCGDGIAQDGAEECDDGKNLIPNDGCFDDCTGPVCGDNIVDITEACDDSNEMNDDGCDNNCTPTQKIIFVSSQLFTGDMGGLGGADAACNAMAKNAMNGPLPGTYMAWLSTDEQSPAQRMNHSTYPYVRSDRSHIADSWNALVTGMMFAPISLNEHGEKHPGIKPLPGGCGWSSVYTSTLASGKGFGLGEDCEGWTSTFGQTLSGSIGLGEVGWTEFCEVLSCETKAPIYCVQQ